MILLLLLVLFLFLLFSPVANPLNSLCSGKSRFIDIPVIAIVLLLLLILLLFLLLLIANPLNAICGSFIDDTDAVVVGYAC